MPKKKKNLHTMIGTSQAHLFSMKCYVKVIYFTLEGNKKKNCATTKKSVMPHQQSKTKFKLGS